MQKAVMGLGLALFVVALVFLLREGDHSLLGESSEAPGAGKPSSATARKGGRPHPAKASRSVSNRTKPQIVYSGPNSAAEWTIQSNDSAAEPWIFENGRLISTGAGTVGQPIITPERFKISFKIAWKNSLRVRFLLLADEPGQNPRTVTTSSYRGDSPTFESAG